MTVDEIRDIGPNFYTDLEPSPMIREEIEDRHDPDFIFTLDDAGRESFLGLVRSRLEKERDTIISTQITQPVGKFEHSNGSVEARESKFYDELGQKFDDIAQGRLTRYRFDIRGGTPTFEGDSVNQMQMRIDDNGTGILFLPRFEALEYTDGTLTSLVEKFGLTRPLREPVVRTLYECLEHPEFEWLRYFKIGGIQSRWNNYNNLGVLASNKVPLGYTEFPIIDEPGTDGRTILGLPVYEMATLEGWASEDPDVLARWIKYRLDEAKNAPAGSSGFLGDTAYQELSAQARLLETDPERAIRENNEDPDVQLWRGDHLEILERNRRKTGVSEAILNIGTFPTHVFFGSLVKISTSK